MKSAKCVGGTDSTGVSDEYVTAYPLEHTITRFAQVQGNATSPRGSMKQHHSAKGNSRVGGTNHDMRAIYAPATAKLCRIAKHELDTHTWQNGVIVRTNTKPSVTHTEVVTVESIPLGTLIRRAERLEMSIMEYVAYIGYTGEVS